MRIFVYGGTGFLGHNFVFYNRSAHDLVVYSRRGVLPEFKRMGVEVVTDVERAMKESDCFVYMVGAMNRKREEEYVETQVKMPVELGKRYRAVNSGKFVYISSVMAYGDTGVRPISEEKDHCVGASPWTIHGITKCKGEREIVNLGNVNILRFPMIYGPFSRIPLWKAYRRTVRMGLGVSYPKPLGFISGKNAYRAIISACSSEKEGFYYASDPKPRTIMDLYNASARSINRGIRIWVPLSDWELKLISGINEITKIASRYVTAGLFFSNEKAMMELGYVPEENLEEVAGHIMNEERLI